MIKPHLLLLLCLLLSLQAFAQTGKTKAKDPFLQKTERVKQLLTAYGALSAQPANAAQTKAIQTMQGQIKTQLLDVLNDKKILTHKPEEVLKHDQLAITRSADSRVYLLSIEEKATDTLTTYLTFLHYRPAEGGPKSELLSGNRYEATYIARYEAIHQVDKDHYLALGKVSICSNCHTGLAVSIQFSNMASGLELVKQIDFRTGDLYQFDYDPRAKTLSYDYRSNSSDPGFPGIAIQPNTYYRIKGKVTYNGNFFAETDNQELEER